MRLSAQMPWPAKAASPWMIMGRTWRRACEVLGGAAVFGEALLIGAGAAHDDGVYGFEMAGVGGEMEMDGFAGGGEEVAGGSGVVFDVAAAEGAAGVYVFELGEDVAGGAVDGVDHDVEAAAVAHGEDGAVDA